MSDPLTIATRVTTVLQLAATATRYLKDIKQGSADRLRLRDELRSTVCVLEMLKDRIEDSYHMPDTGEALKPVFVGALGGAHSPLSFFQRILEDVIAKLAPQRSSHRLAQPYIWPFNKKDISEKLVLLDRLKSDFGLIMQNDLIELAKLSNLQLIDLSQKAEKSEIDYRDNEARKIILWICPISFRARHVDVLESVESGTGTWLLEHGIFRSWLKGDIDTLWCPGIPGAGKTSLVSLIIDQIERERTMNTDCVYIYCDYNRRNEQTPSILLSCLLQQALQNSKNLLIPPEVSMMYNQHVQYGTRPTQAQIIEILRKLAAKLTSFYIVIDALDECAESEDDALQFVTAIRSLGPHVKVLCTSRFSGAFDEYFAQSEKLMISAKNDDIARFLDLQIPRKHRLLRHIRADPDLKNDIIETIIQECQGMFLLAKLHLESLSQKISRKEIRSSLRTLPISLDITYSNALERIYRQAQDAVDLAECVLFWVLCVKRPLTITELQQIYATRELPKETGLEDDDLPDGDILIDVCRGLVNVDNDSKNVRIVHYSAQQYLERSHSRKLTQARMSITRISLKYLALPNFSSGTCKTDREMGKRIEQYPFLDYAAKNWGSEISKLDSDDMTLLLEDFLSNVTAVEMTNQVLSLPSVRRSNWSQEFPRQVPALVLAAAFDLPTTLAQMVSNGHRLEGQGTDGETALIRAASFGHQENVRALLDLGANINALDHVNETALQKAARNGEQGVVEVLLRRGADVKSRSFSNWTALMSAVSSGNIDVVQMLVRAGAELTAETIWGDSALSIAARNGQEAIAMLLADHGAILPRGPAGRRASSVAYRKGFLQLVRRLTADYDAIARKPLQRQDSILISGLGSVQEESARQAEEETVVNTTSSSEPGANDRDQDDFSEVMEDLESSIGFSSRFNLEESIGSGYFSQVFRCTNKVTGLAYAAKVTTVKRWNRADVGLQAVRTESRMLREALDKCHANILSMIHLFTEYADSKIYMVLELAPRGDLFEFIVAKKRLTEYESREVFVQIVSALDFLHDLGWVHRDVKTENILLFETESTHVKLADFGLAKKLSGLSNDGSKFSSTLYGTPAYSAPEILADRKTREYGYGVDVWSAGVVLYICLCGFPPFSDELYSKGFPYTLSQQIKTARFDYPSPYWDSVGDPALDLIESMLVVEPSRRFTVKQCSTHPWSADKSRSILEVGRSASPEPI